MLHESVGRAQSLVVSGRLGQVGEEMAEATVSESQPAALRIATEQDLGDGQADQLGVGEASRSARTLACVQQVEEVVDLDVECHDEGVEFGMHTPYLGALALLVTACFLLTANSEALI
jgi:hypothetical protein